MSARIVVATARRVLAQLRGDRRTVALLLVVPSLLLVLTNQMFDSRPAFDRVALIMLGIFPFTTMFLVTSIAMLRERTTGTLERLLTTPLAQARPAVRLRHRVRRRRGRAGRRGVRDSPTGCSA